MIAFKALWKFNRPTRAKAPLLSIFRAALDGLITPGEMVNIVQVGANDGVINDPLHHFLRDHRDETQVILIEPQADLIPILSRSYEFHPRKVILQAAVAAEGRLRLFKVRKECWPDLVVNYAEDWPDYRAPTGVTSADRDRLATWVRQHYRGPLAVDDVIEPVEVEAGPTSALIARAGLFQRLDVLQVDAEGFDDEVIRLSDIVRLKPRLIHFEVIHLGAMREAAICDELRGLGYRIKALGMITLALLAG